MFKNLSPEDTAAIGIIIWMLWMTFTSYTGHNELWAYPLFALCGLAGLHMILMLIRDIYMAKRRERMYERRMLERLNRLEYEKDKGE